MVNLLATTGLSGHEGTSLAHGQSFGHHQSTETLSWLMVNSLATDGHEGCWLTVNLLVAIGHKDTL